MMTSKRPATVTCLPTACGSSVCKNTTAGAGSAKSGGTAPRLGLGCARTAREPIGGHRECISAAGRPSAKCAHKRGAADAVVSQRGGEDASDAVAMPADLCPGLLRGRGSG
jgi:hypothetical protein